MKQQIHTTTTTTTTKTPAKAATEAPEADPRDLELAELRERLANIEAAVARQQELQANAILWADCPCGENYRAATQFTNAGIRNGRLWHDLGHYSYFGIKQAAA